ncbi:MAG: hypothetical protein WD603_01535 [Patescibacteria group bacterium]
MTKEKHIRVPVGSGKSVKGFLRGPLAKPLVIFVHGLTNVKPRICLRKCAARQSSCRTPASHSYCF